MSEQKVSLTDREKAVTNVEVKVIETVDLSAAFKSQTSKSKSQIIYLRLDGDFQPGHHDVANFYYSLDGENWTKIGTENYRMIFDMPPRKLAAMLTWMRLYIARVKNNIYQ